MATKPNFLKNIKTGLATVSAAAFIIGAGSTAFGVDTVSIAAGGSSLSVPAGWQQGANNNAPIVGANNMVFFGVNQDMTFDVAVGDLGTLNVYGFNGRTVNVNHANQLQSVINDITPAIAARATAANHNVAVNNGAVANARVNFDINFGGGAGGVMEFGNNGIGDLSALGNISFHHDNDMMKISANKQHIQQITGAAQGNGVVMVNATDVVFDQTIGAHGAEIDALNLSANTSATLNANAFLMHIVLEGGSILTVGNGVNLTTAKNGAIEGQAANEGTLAFVGNSVVDMEIGGGGNPINTINIGAGIVEFKAAGGAVEATNINLTDNASVMKLSTAVQNVAANITTVNDGKGIIVVQDTKHNITGTIGTAANQLEAIQFLDDHLLVIENPGVNAPLGVKNITTKVNNQGVLILKRDHDIVGTIGTSTKNLRGVGIHEGAGAFAKVTLKENQAINATDLDLVTGAAVDNILQLENETAVHGNIITSRANNGIINVTGASSTITGNIGQAAQPINQIKLGGNSLTVGGAEINTANGIDFAVQGGLLNLTADLKAAGAPANLTVNSQIVAAAGEVSIITANNITDNNTLVFTEAITGPLKVLQVTGGAAITLSKDAKIESIEVGNTNTKLNLSTGAASSYMIGSFTHTNENGIVTINNDTVLLEGTSLSNSADKLNAIEFVGNKQLTLGKNVGLHAKAITNGAVIGDGKFIFDGSGANIVDAKIGDVNNGKFGTLTVNANTKATLLQNAYFNGITKLALGSTLEIGGDYMAASVEGVAAANGIFRTINTNKDITVTFTNAGPAANAISKVEIAGGNVRLVNTNAPAGGALNGITTTTIAFTNAATPSTLTLPEGVNVKNINIVNTADNNVEHVIFAPRSAAAATNHTIVAGQRVGSDGNIVYYRIGNKAGLNETIEVNEPHFFAGIRTTKNNSVEAKFNAADGTVYGLGEDGKKLSLVTFTDHTTNFGNTYVTKLVIEDGKMGTLNGIIDSNVQLGTTGAAAGGVLVEFGNGVNILSTSALTSNKADDSIVTFQGDSIIAGTIGTSAQRNAKVIFNGTGTQTLSGAIYSNNVDFGNTNIKLSGDATLDANTELSFNGNMDLGSKSLTFVGDNINFGKNTTIATTLTTNGKLGNIDATKAQISVAGNVTINVNDQALLTTDEKFVLVYADSNRNFEFQNGGQPIIGSIVNNNRYSDLTIGLNPNDLSDKNIYLFRGNKAATVLPNDVIKVGGDAIDLQNAAALANPNNARNSEAHQFVTNAGNYKDSVTAGKAVLKLVNSVSHQVTAEQEKAITSLENIIMTRTATQLSDDRYLTGAPAAGDDELTRYGSWAMPFYNQANQKARHGMSGYKAKTFGGIFGLDTRANDNLTIGAAVAATKTDMKHKNIKAGDKTTINSFMFSLYGAQQLLDNFFVQAVASYSSGKVKNKERRFISTANGQSVETAHGNYTTMTFGGEVLFGYNAKPIESVLFTPMAGLRYNKSTDEGYKETGTTFQNKTVSKKSTDKVEAILGAKVTTAVNLNDMTVAPEAHAFVSHKLSGKAGHVSAKLDGMVDPFVTRTDKTAKTFYNLGLGVSAKAGSMMEYGIGYDATLAKKYVGHQGTLKVRVNF